MSCSIITAAALLLAPIQSGAPDVQASEETLSDGTILVRSGYRGEDGALVLHGELRHVGANDSKLATGEYVHGKKDGRWRYWYPNGDVRVLGKYREGVRSGEWTFRYPAGGSDAEDLRAEGSYEDGVRSGEWLVRRPDGSLHEAESGVYQRELSAPRRRKSDTTPRRYEGLSVDGEMHGRWTFTWENHEKMLEAQFARGVRVGTWRFWHPEGTYDPEFLSGAYAEYVEFDDLDEEPFHLDVWVTSGSTVEAAADRATEPSPGLLPDLEPAKLEEKERKSVDAALAALRAGSADEAGRATKKLAGLGATVMPDVINELKALDLASQRATWIERELLRPVLKGHGFGWRTETTPEALRANKLAALRWYSFYLVTRDVAEFWEVELALAPAREAGEYPALYRPPFRGERVLRAAVPGGPYARRFQQRDLEAAGGSGTEQALRDGLEWLKRHQAPDGSWDSDGFAERCPKSSQCSGPGKQWVDVGVTSLALLAFLGDGHTMTHGYYQDVVRDGVVWLIDQQDLNTGMIAPSRGGHSRHYQHAIALQVLCEALAYTENLRLRTAAQKAVNYATRVRNPYGAWRYESPPDGKNDTSVTAWMIAGLVSAQRVGLKTDPEALEGGRQWLDEITDPASGRVGYERMGSMSARVKGANDHYPAEKGEAMTAAGLYTRFLIGQSPGRVPMLMKHADLMLKTLPYWEPESYGCDMYYWYYGSLAMYQMGGKFWKGWNVAMKKTLLESQVVPGDAGGSWDPVGPWGYFGGRVYSTAMCTLSLEVYFRYGRGLGER